MKSIFINHNFTDFLACINFLSEEEKLAITEVYFASADELKIKTLLKFVFPNLRNITTVVPRNNITKTVKADEINVSMLNLIDIDVETIKKEVLGYTRMFNKFNFPKVAELHIPHYNYAVITSRNFDVNDELECVSFLRSRNLLGIVLNDGFNFKSIHERIIDYSNQYNFLQRVELLKKAKAFYGDAGELSVVASKLFKSDDLYILKSNFDTPAFYFAPREWPIQHNQTTEEQNPFSSVPRL